MRAVLFAQFRTLFRKPWGFIALTITSILFSFVLGMDGNSSRVIPVYQAGDESVTEEVLDILETESTHQFRSVEKSEVIRLVKEGRATAGLFLFDDKFKMVTAAENGSILSLEQQVKKAYVKRLQKEKLRESGNDQATVLMKRLEEDLFDVKTVSVSSEEVFEYDNQLHALYGMTVFYVIYTIAFNVIHILTAKQHGIWDRMILSPAKKWEIYTGILSYAFVLGYMQVAVIFGLFKWGLGVDFYGGFLKTLIVMMAYVLAIVALSVLIVGISKNLPTFNTLVSLLSVSLAMIGGAFWPIELVSNKYMLFFAKFDPITYVLEALKQVTLYQGTMTDALYPISVLLFMSVIMMGVGMNLMERRND